MCVGARGAVQARSPRGAQHTAVLKMGFSCLPCLHGFSCVPAHNAQICLSLSRDSRPSTSLCTSPVLHTHTHTHTHTNTHTQTHTHTILLLHWSCQLESTVKAKERQLEAGQKALESSRCGAARPMEA